MKLADRKKLQSVERRVRDMRVSHANKIRRQDTAAFHPCVIMEADWLLSKAKALTGEWTKEEAAFAKLVKGWRVQWRDHVGRGAFVRLDCAELILPMEALVAKVKAAVAGKPIEADEDLEEVALEDVAAD